MKCELHSRRWFETNSFYFVTSIHDSQCQHVCHIWFCVPKLCYAREHAHVLSRGTHLMIRQLLQQSVIELGPCVTSN